MRFKPGEHARIIKVGPNHSFLIGKECIVVGPEDITSAERGKQYYIIDIPGVSPAPGKESFIARDDNLAKLLPPGWQKTTWEKCLWHPEFVKAARP